MSQNESANQIQSISLALQGLLLGFLLIYPALQGINIFGLQLGFIFLPIVAVYYWPDQASYSWSLICVFLLGLTYDLISAGPIGLWSLSFLILYLVLSASERVNDGVLRGTFAYALCLALVLVLLLVLGRVAVGRLPQFGVLFMNAVASIAVFPFLYWLRSLARAVRGTPDISRVR